MAENYYNHIITCLKIVNTDYVEKIKAYLFFIKILVYSLKSCLWTKAFRTRKFRLKLLKWGIDNQTQKAESWKQIGITLTFMQIEFIV